MNKINKYKNLSGWGSLLCTSMLVISDNGVVSSLLTAGVNMTCLSTRATTSSSLSDISISHSNRRLMVEFQWFFIALSVLKKNKTIVYLINTSTKIALIDIFFTLTQSKEELWDSSSKKLYLESVKQTNKAWRIYQPPAKCFAGSVFNEQCIRLFWFQYNHRLLTSFKYVVCYMMYINFNTGKTKFIQDLVL